ncbi:MAG: tRNA uridine-5-carboxymethylaminomethyl(34) synthesis GTPase MnmE [Clostridia bacterium]|nr:tRNA uridine-5-carboxymethylaminomethyl(34) synthesis GTPase MnmE [Clostridia bacterium]
MLNSADTICAIATGTGGSISIVRVSGENAFSILKRCFSPLKRIKNAYGHGRMMYGNVYDANGDTLDEAMAVCFYAPNSYTTEDVFEIQMHGGDMSAQAVLKTILSLGARMAEPGEFTRRAFLNGRIDLSEAEAVMGIVGAKSQSARRASVRQLKGGVSAGIGKAREELISLVALISAATDFPDEIDEDVTAQKVADRARKVMAFLKSASDRKHARIMMKGASVVLAGLPNVGKSSVMNALLSCDRAIVTDIPGTTRDVLTESVELNGVRLALSDTAGLRETEDAVEKIGVQRAKDALENADVILYVLDAAREMTDEEKENLSQMDERYIVLLNKSDLTQVVSFENAVTLSAKTGEGLETLTDRILEKIGADGLNEDMMTLPRHIECAERAVEAIERAVGWIESAMPLDFAANDLSEALEALGDITGESMNESVIDRVFADFCVGK